MEVIDDFWATFGSKKDQEDDGEDKEEGQDDDREEDDEDDHGKKDESKEFVEANTVVDPANQIDEPPKSVRSYKPTSAKCPKATMRKAANKDFRKALNLKPVARGPEESKSGSGIPGFTAASYLGKETQPPLANKPASKTQKPEEDRNIAMDVEADSSASHKDISKQDAISGIPSALVPVTPQPPSFTPFSHTPIYVNEPGHGHLKSRVVFEADTIPHEQHYVEIVPANNRMTALQKLKAWRQNFGSKLKDGQLRKAERLVILNEGVPSMARNELSLYTDTLKGLGSWIKQFMPDSFVVIKTTIPANTYTRVGRFHAYIDAIYHLIEKYPFHFSAEIEDKSILAMGITANTQDVTEELAFALNFVNSVELFRQHGYLLAGDEKPFFSMKSKKKRNKITDGYLDPEREAKIIATLLPWIPEQFVRNFYANCIAHPDQDLGDLEYEQTGLNPEALTPQETVGFIASMNRSLFARPSHTGLRRSNQM